MKILCLHNNYTLIAATIFMAAANANSANALHLEQLDLNDAQKGEVAKANKDTSDTKKQSDNNKAINAKSKKTDDPDKVYLVADEVVYLDDGEILEAVGNVEAKTSKRTMFADKIRFDQKTNVVTAIGNVIIIETDGTINYANEVNVDDKLDSGIISDFATRMTDGGILAAKTATQEKNQKNVLAKAIYTSCKVCKENPVPTWSVKARSAIQDKNSKSFTYRDVVFEIEGVPLFYIPYFRHGDPTQGSQSGFLPPKPSKSSRLGWGWQQSYLQVIDESSDIVITPAIYQYVAPVLGLEYRRKFYSGQLKFTGTATKEQLFTSKDTKTGEIEWRSHIFGNGEFEIAKNWKWGFGLESASDLYYLYRYSIPGRSTQRGLIKSTGVRLISQLYAQGQSEDFFSRIMGIKFQELDPRVDSKKTPKVLPSLEINKSYKIGPWNGKLRTNSSLLYLDRAGENQNTGRVATDLFWHGQKATKSGLLLEPQLFVRGAYYHYTNQIDANNALIGDNNFGRFSAGIGVNLSFPLAKFEKGVSYLIEPKLNLQLKSKQSGGKYVSPEDAFNYQNDDTSYFEHTSSVTDIWSGGAIATMGVALSAAMNGNKSINWFVGKQFISESDPLLGRASNLDKKSLDWVSRLDLKIGNNLDLNARVRIDDNGNLGRAEVAGTTQFGKMTIQIGYTELSDKLVGMDFSTKELVTSATYSFNDRVKLFADNWHDFKTGNDLRQRFGIIFGDECTDARLYYELSNESNGIFKPSRNIKFQIAFKNLGTIDDEPFYVQ